MGDFILFIKKYIKKKNNRLYARVVPLVIKDEVFYFKIWDTMAALGEYTVEREERDLENTREELNNYRM